jgi:hypothetical protein|tara:strand:+ start:8155 stop:8343 length:189 start_codon:yes stop_codon:yes gene_type:complete
MYKVVISRLILDGKSYSRGDVIDIPEEQAATLGVQLEKVTEVKRKRGRPRKDESQREVSGQQ